MSTRASRYIRNTLQRHLHALQGEFVKPKNAYEQKFCDIFLWDRVDHRYFDASDGVAKIEIKKGQSSMWFDLCRYAEIHTGIGTKGTYTVFLKWNKKKLLIEECYIIDTEKLISFFGLSQQDWEYAIEMKKKVPRGLNMLASLTWKDMKSIATHIVS